MASLDSLLRGAAAVPVGLASRDTCVRTHLWVRRNLMRSPGGIRDEQRQSRCASDRRGGRWWLRRLQRRQGRGRVRRRDPGRAARRVRPQRRSAAGARRARVASENLSVLRPSARERPGRARPRGRSRWPQRHARFGDRAYARLHRPRYRFDLSLSGEVRHRRNGHGSRPLPREPRRTGAGRTSADRRRRADRARARR